MVRRQVACIALLAAVPIVVFAARPGLGEDPEAALLRILGPDAREPAIVVVGSASCPECRDAIRALDGRRAAARRVLFVRRASDGAPPPGNNLLVRVVPDDLWWRLLRGEPPALLQIDARGETTRLASVEAALALR